MRILQRTLNQVQTKYSRETCYPPKDQIFSAFQKCTFENCKVVIVGQDPYIDENQAMGMCFSVPKYQKFPPSLRNIFKCIIDDTDVPEFTQQPKHGDLTKWAMQGVLLLNANLTVTKKKANSHSTLGWEKLTDKIIKILNQQKKNLVFMLWGNYAQKKISFINENKHLILKACHPSPLAANKGDFVTCKHFSKCNKYLQENEIGTIEWKLE